MRSNAAEKPVYRSSQRNDDHAAPHPAPLPPLMTPARRMALEALEREFHDLLLRAAPR